MKTTFIYALKCPTTGQIRYVGKSNKPKTRLPQHVSECRTKKHYRANWINALAAGGFKPTLEVVDEVPFEYWKQLEVAYIEFFLEMGYALTNTAPGGEDPPSYVGRKHPPEACAAISAARKGKPLKPEHIAKLSEAKKGTRRSLESCAKQSGSTKGVPKPAGFSDKLRARTGEKRSPEARAKMRASRLAFLERQRLQKEITQ